MSYEIHDMRAEDAPPPPKLAAHFGRRVLRAWISPSGRLLALRLEGGWLAHIEAMRSDIPGCAAVIEVTVGEMDESADWSFLDRESQPQTPHTLALRGKRITGFHGGTLEFDNRYGVKVKPDGIQWVVLATDKARKAKGKRRGKA